MKRAIVKDGTRVGERDTLTDRTKLTDRDKCVDSTSVIDRDKQENSTNYEDRDKAFDSITPLDRIRCRESTMKVEWLDRLLTDRAMKRHNRRMFQLISALTTIGNYETETTTGNS